MASFRLRFLGAAAIAVMLAAAFTGSARAQAPGGGPRRALSMTPGFEPGLPVDIKAESLEYEGDGRYLIGRGGVHIRQGRQIMTADYVQYNPTTKDALARGHVVFVRADGMVWKGEELAYNFETGLGDFGVFTLYSEPYFVYGEDAAMPATNVVTLKDVILTTCEGEAPREFEVRLREATLTDQRYLVARDAVVYVGPVPIMWWPVYKRDLHGSSRWDIVPGYSSRLGGYLTVSYNYPINDTGTFRGSTFASYYSERGLGFGQDFKWKALSNETYRGQLNSFYIDDQQIYRDENEQAQREEYLTDPERYRLRLQHTHMLSDRDLFMADGTYLSDPYVNDDFFRRDYRYNVQPENRATLSHRGDVYNASLQLNSRLNDFYENINRLPEAQLDVQPVEMGPSGVYYESSSTAAGLEHVYAEPSDREDYDAFRFDTYHMLSYPGKYFGFLSFTPRAGYRGTYYSKTLGDAYSVTNPVTLTDTNGITSTTNTVDTIYAEEGADMRHLLELGFESSFKAYKVLDNGETIWGRGLRHVAEPYVRYTYIPEPDLMPDHLYQFDSIDRLGRDHSIGLGLRNKLQTRRRNAMYIERSSYRAPGTMEANFDSLEQGRMSELPGAANSLMVHDLVDLNLSTYYLVEKEDDQEDFGPLYALLQFRPSRYVRIDSEAQYDMYESILSSMNTQVAISTGDFSSLTLEHIYYYEQRNLIAAQLDLLPKAKWSFRLYGRYEAETSRLEEHSYFVRHEMKCVGWGIGFRHEPGYDGQEDDYGVWAQFWLLDIPGGYAQVGG